MPLNNWLPTKHRGPPGSLTPLLLAPSVRRIPPQSRAAWALPQPPRFPALAAPANPPPRSPIGPHLPLSKHIFLGLLTHSWSGQEACRHSPPLPNAAVPHLPCSDKGELTRPPPDQHPLQCVPSMLAQPACALATTAASVPTECAGHSDRTVPSRPPQPARVPIKRLKPIVRAPPPHRSFSVNSKLTPPVFSITASHHRWL
jgi:hypothetical protein